MRKVKLFVALLACGALFSCSGEKAPFTVSVESQPNEDGAFNDFLLTVDDNGEKYTYSLFKGHSCEEPVVCDVDGDGRKEIIVNELVGVTGGFGNYESYVFRYGDGKFEEIFNSSKMDEPDTGFRSEIKENFVVEISNELTGFSTEVDYYANSCFYNEDGTVIDGTNDRENLIVDTFYKFYPEDIDDDGISEIVCYQYMAMSTHVEYIGDGVTYLKYNSENENFEIVKSDFVPSDKTYKSGVEFS